MCGRFSPSYCQSEGLFDELNKVKNKGKVDKEFIILPALRVADKLTDF